VSLLQNAVPVKSITFACSILKITAKAINVNDIVDVLVTAAAITSTFAIELQYDLAASSDGQSGEKSCKEVENAKGCYGSDVVARGTDGDGT